jgi:hypothetical protein
VEKNPGISKLLLPGIGNYLYLLRHSAANGITGAIFGDKNSSMLTALKNFDDISYVDPQTDKTSLETSSLPEGNDFDHFSFVGKAQGKSLYVFDICIHIKNI